MKLVECIKENPKSIAFTASLILTVLSIIFAENELISAVLMLITSYAGLEVKNYMNGAVENNENEEGA